MTVCREAWSARSATADLHEKGSAMHIIRSERNAAILLLLAAVLGLALANSPAGPQLLELQSTHLVVPLVGDLSLAHWISDGLLAIFFFVVAVELKHELTVGSLSNMRQAAVPAIAALGGVVVPAVLYAAFTASSGLARGWPIPTATDIAFALGVLALLGRGLPPRIRVFLLALAVLDDLVAIGIIAVFFTSSIDVVPLLLAVLCAAAAGGLSRVRLRRGRWLVAAGITVLALATWVFTLHSGVHATLAGVAVGLAVARKPGGKAAHELQPYSNGVVLPLFAFSAALVPLTGMSAGALSPAFWAILVALPVGKLVGIAAAGHLATRLLHREGADSLVPADLIAVGALGGIGFTVSLLMTELAFEDTPLLVDEGTLAVLLGSVVAIAVSVVLVRLRVRRYRRAAHPADAAA